MDIFKDFKEAIVGIPKTAGVTGSRKGFPYVPAGLSVLFVLCVVFRRRVLVQGSNKVNSLKARNPSLLESWVTLLSDRGLMKQGPT